MTLSIVMIVKNEAANMDDCLRAIDWADEIVVVDSGSDDETVKIAKKYTSNIYIEDDWKGYGVQRQRAQQKATSDWVLMLDADERITPKLAGEIERVVEEDNRNNIYAVPRLSWCFGRYIRHSGWYPDFVARLYPREKAGYGEVRVHEELLYPKSMHKVNLTGDMLHFTYRSMEHYLVKSAKYADEWAAEKQIGNKQSSILQGCLHGIGCFLRMYVFKAGFLDGKQGLLLALLSAHSTFVKYADLWVRQQSSQSSTDSNGRS